MTTDREERPLKSLYTDAAGARAILGVASRTTVTMAKIPIAAVFNCGNVYLIDDVIAAARLRNSGDCDA